MLADPRSEQLVDNFAGQWLSLRALQTQAPVTSRVSRFRRQSAPGHARRKRNCSSPASFTKIAASSICSMPTTRSSMSGWPSTTASRTSTAAISAASSLAPEFDMRRGLLGKGMLETISSQPDRTSPVQRGKTVMQIFLGVEPPPPPPNVPRLEVKSRATSTAARSRPCGSRWKCTARTSPAPAATRSWTRSASRWRISTRSGTGARRTTAAPIDAAGVLVDGSKLDGVNGLRDGAGPLLAAVRARRHREADDLRAGPRDGILRHAAGPVDRA